MYSNPNLKPFSGFPLPDFHALCCPHCNHWKMYPHNLGDIEGFLCAGPTTVPLGYDPDRFITCGKFTSRLKVETFVGLMIVGE
jgi:hypothetical protein